MPYRKACDRRPRRHGGENSVLKPASKDALANDPGLLQLSHWMKSAISTLSSTGWAILTPGREPRGNKVAD